MAKRNTSININGKRYDAITGSLIEQPHGARKTSRSIDGVVGMASNKIVTTAAPISVPAPKPHPIKPAHTPAAHAKTHKVTPSTTLMRSAVKKPVTTSLKRTVKVQGTAKPHTPLVSTQSTSIVHKTYFHKVNDRRLNRATQIDISPKVARFAYEVASNMPIAVKQASIEINKQFIVPVTPTRTVTAYRPDVVRTSKQQSTSDVFAKALARATSHEEVAPVVKRTSKSKVRAARLLRNRMVSYGSGAIAVLAIVGFLGFHNADTIKFKLAANKAGFAATMPAYRPEGFTLANVQTNGGLINVSYNQSNGSDSGQSFALTEKASNWNSETLLANITGNTKNNAYSVIETAGRTVYVYGKNQAAWVNNGILYQILGNGALSSTDFGKIAASM